MRAASRLKGTAEATLKEGGSTRPKPLARRREMPVRLPRVGERPAGAERGTEVVSLVRGDLALAVGRGRGRGVLAVDLGLRKREGLKGSLEKAKGSVPLGRLERRGSRFSASSSTSSEALRLVAAGAATVC